MDTPAGNMYLLSMLFHTRHYFLLVAWGVGVRKLAFERFKIQKVS